jgi:hypothetical protein
MSILSAFESLTDLANTYQSDKGTAHFERHGYTEVYERLFRCRKWSRLTLLEVGLRHDPYYGAQVPPLSPSLQMWRDYFPRALICGFDINDFTHMNAGRVRIFVGDQGDEATLKQVLEVVPAFDIIIDDGSHASFIRRPAFAPCSVRSSRMACTSSRTCTGSPRHSSRRCHRRARCGSNSRIRLS